MTKKLFEEFPAATKADWIEKAKKSISNPEELKKLLFRTEDGFQLAAMYALEDLKSLDSDDSAEIQVRRGFGNIKTVHIRQRIYLSKFMETNQLIVEAIEGGADEIEIVGESFGTEAEFKSLIQKIDFSKIPVHFDFGESNNALVFVLADELSTEIASGKKCFGSVSLDPLGELLSTGNFDYPQADTFSALATVIKVGSIRLPDFKFLHVNASRLNLAGASDATELGFAISAITEYFHILSEKGFNLSDLVSKIQFTLAASTDYFGTIAKLRAFRILWANLAEAFEIKDVVPHVNVCASEYSFTVYDAHNNLLRATTQAMSAFAGGCNSFTFLPFDKSYKKPDSFSYRTARNIGNILRFESGMMQVNDPAGGSYFIENYTDRMTVTAWEYFTECEKRGGFIEALKQKYIQGLIEQNAQKRADAFAKGEIVLTGTNKYLFQGENMKDKYLKNDERPNLKDEFLVMPLPPKRLSQKLDEARLKRDGVEFQMPETDLILGDD